jgi:outer membrane protein, multidrug efflux system
MRSRIVHRRRVRKQQEASPTLKLVCSALLCVLAGCTVGPDYHAPSADADAPASWHDTHRTAASSPLSPSSPSAAAGALAAPPISASAASAGNTMSNAAAVPSTPVEQADPDPLWWHGFNDPLLNQLIERAASGNLDLQQAVLRIVEARTQVQSAAAAGLPNVRATGSYTREQLGAKGLLESNGVYNQVDTLGAPNSPLNTISPGLGARAQNGANNLLNQLTSPINLWQVGFDASWELDLFGRVRRSVEAADAQTQAAIENRNDALVSLEAEVAQTYMQLRGAQALYAITRRLIGEEQQILDLTRAQAAAGITSQLDVESASAQLTTIQSQLPQYDQQIEQAMNGLCYLLGEAPGALDDLLVAPAEVPGVPPQVPVGIPSTLARRRPDIRAAEAQLHAATADVGVAVAQFYPDISLTGEIGTRGEHARELAHWSSLFYSFGPSISLPIFQGGALVANLRMSKAEQASAALQYRKVVLTALRDVDNALVVYRTDQSRRLELGNTVAAQQTSFDLSSDSYRKGLVSFITVLDAERQLAQARQQYVQGTTQVTTDLVALYKALGGGWESGTGDASREGDQAVSAR